MGLQQTQDAHQVDKFVNSILSSTKSLEERVAQLEANEGQSPIIPDPLACAILQDQKAAGTNGGDATSGSWFTRTLNTEVSDPYGIVVLSANQFTLQAGTYLVWGSAPGLGTNRTKARFRNITDGITTAVGQNVYLSAPDSGSGFSLVVMLITLAVDTIFELQMRVENSVAGFGCGAAAGAWGEVEVYSSVEILKLA